MIDSTYIEMAAGQVRYNPKYKKELHDKFGPGVIAKLFELIGDGSIEQSRLKKMSYSYHMNVSETFNQCLSEKKKEKATLEDMLDKWYEEFLAVKSVSEARSEFLRILGDTCNRHVCSSIEKELEKCNEAKCDGSHNELDKVLEEGVSAVDEVIPNLENIVDGKELTDSSKAKKNFSTRRRYHSSVDVISRFEYEDLRYLFDIILYIQMTLVIFNKETTRIIV